MRQTDAAPRRTKVLRAMVAALFWLAVWQLLSMTVGQELLLPSPLAVAATWWRLLFQIDFWLGTALSLLRVVGGFLLGVLGGCLLAPLMERFAWLRTLLSPVLRVIRAVPIASFIMLALLWLEADWLPVFIVLLMVLPVVCDNVREGLTQTNRGLIEMAVVCGLSPKQIWWKVRLPSLMPYITAACTAGMGFAWKSGIAAEVLCRPGLSIGGALQNAKIYLETPEMFAWTATVILLSLLLERFLIWNMKTWGRRYKLA